VAKKIDPAIERRLKALERRIGVSHETQDFVDRLKAKGGIASTASTQALKSFKVLSDGSAGPSVATVDVVFDLTDTPKAPGMVRIYQAGSKPGDEIASSQKPHGVLPAQVVGSDLQLIMDIMGNVGEKGGFSVKAALPTPLTLVLDTGPTKKVLKYLHVTG
jgi:hypothetical protein